MAVQPGALEGLVTTMPLFNDYFRERKVLVTGHTGFKGSWLCLWLRELGAEVTGYSLEPPSQPSLFEQAGFSKRVRSLTGDVRDLPHLEEVIESVQPEIIFHLAAKPLVKESYENPVETISTNVLGTVNVLEAVRRAGASVRVCQIITSDKCYENDESNHGHPEEDRMGGRDPYSASKGSAELLVSAYRRSFFPPGKFSEHGISVSTVRAGNVIGGGDWGRDRLIPDCIQALSQGKPIYLRNPQAIRPWQFVLDALSGYLCLAEQQASGSPTYAEAWNFGPEPSADWTVVKLAEGIITLWGEGRWLPAEESSSKSSLYPESQFLTLDCSKANRLLDWRPVYNTDESVQETVRWYRETRNLPPDRVYDYSVRQWGDYLRAAQKKRCPWTLQEKALR